MAFRVALLGTGVIATPHTSALRELGPMVEVAAVCDLDRAKAEAFRQLWAIPAAYEDLDTMIGEVRPDVVHVLLPPAAPALMAQACLDRGCHVFVEKPFSLTSNECRAVVRAAERNGRKVGVNHNLTYMPSVLKLIDEIRSCRLGEAQHTTVMYSLPMPALATGPHDQWMFGGMERILLELGPHPLSVVYRLMGPVQFASTSLAGPRILSNGRMFHDTWQMSLVCRRGTAQCVLALGGEYLNTWVHVLGQDGEAWADLRRNTVRVSEKTRYARTDNLVDAWRNGAGVIRQSARNFAAQMKGALGLGPPYEMQTLSMNASIRAFYQALADGRKPPVDGEDGTAVVELCEAAIRSATISVQEDAHAT
jgi:predicted dehydrogenase